MKAKYSPILLLIVMLTPPVWSRETINVYTYHDHPPFILNKGNVTTSQTFPIASNWVTRLDPLVELDQSKVVTPSVTATNNGGR